MIKIICVGKNKENYLKEALDEYKKRISKYTNIEIIELDDYNYDVKKTLLTEYNSIIKEMNPSDYNILLDISGVELDSFLLFYQYILFLSLKLSYIKSLILTSCINLNFIVF